jgi:hypothetical protein
MILAVLKTKIAMGSRAQLTISTSREKKRVNGVHRVTRGEQFSLALPAGFGCWQHTQHALKTQTRSTTTTNRSKRNETIEKKTRSLKFDRRTTLSFFVNTKKNERTRRTFTALKTQFPITNRKVNKRGLKRDLL